MPLPRGWNVDSVTAVTPLWRQRETERKKRNAPLNGLWCGGRHVDLADVGGRERALLHVLRSSLHPPRTFPLPCRAQGPHTRHRPAELQNLGLEYRPVSQLPTARKNDRIQQTRFREREGLVSANRGVAEEMARPPRSEGRGFLPENGPEFPAKWAFPSPCSGGCATMHCPTRQLLATSSHR